MKRVLVVDDEPAIRYLVAASLVDCDYEVLAAADGAGALEAIRESRPDLILLDCALPGMHGSEVIRQIRADEQTADVPVLYLTGLEPLTGPRPDGILRKPFTPEGLRASVSAWLD